MLRNNKKKNNLYNRGIIRYLEIQHKTKDDRNETQVVIINDKLKYVTFFTF